MNPRCKALESVEKRSRHSISELKSAGSSETFGMNVFNRSIMQKMLPKEVYKNVLNA